MAAKSTTKSRLRSAIELALIALGLAILLLGGTFLLTISRPAYSSLKPESIKFTRVEVDGKVYVLFEGEPSSPTAQIQARCTLVDVDSKTIRIYAYRMIWHPLSKVFSHQNWPIIQDLTPLPTGEYSIVCLVNGEYREIGVVKR
jgi:hypothetical protein